jgi:hypothetical protein
LAKPASSATAAFVAVAVHVKPLRESKSSEGMLLVTFLDRGQNTRAQGAGAPPREAMDEAALVHQLDL